MKKLLALLFFLSTFFAQQTWIKTYGGVDDDRGYSVQQTTDGGYIVAGYACSYWDTLGDVYLIKTDSIGDTLWIRTYGGLNVDEGHSVQQTLDGGYVITGRTNSFGAGDYDAYVIKTDSFGDSLWTKTFGGTGYDEGNSVQQTLDGGYIIAGTSIYQVYLIKTNNQGDTLWTQFYGRTNPNIGYSVRQTSDGGYIIAGRTWGSPFYDVYFIKTNSLGDTLWTRIYGDYHQDEGHSVQQTSDGGYIIAGFTNSFGASVDVYFIKTDSLGDTLWTRIYGGTSADWGYSVQQTLDGGYVIAGSTYSFGAGGYDVYLIKTDVYGNAAVEERNTSAQSVDVGLKILPNPFTSFARIPGYEKEDFNVSDITGRMVGKYKGAKIGENLSAGVYFIIPQDKSLKPVRIVKIK